VSCRLFGIAISFPSMLKILSVIVSPLPRSFLVRSSLIVLLCRFSGVPKILVVSPSIGICTSMYFFLSAIIQLLVLMFACLFFGLWLFRILCKCKRLLFF